MNGERIAVVGLGYVGLTLANLCVTKGFDVVGIDIDVQKINALRSGSSYLSDVRDEQIEVMTSTQRFHPTTNYAAIKDRTTIIFCLPTPLKNKQPDLSYIRYALQGIRPHLQRGQLLVIESSFSPGTTEEILLPLIESNHYKVGNDIFLAYSPERVDPGNQEFPLYHIPKVISGVTTMCLQKIEQLYKQLFDRVVPVKNTKTAEFVKMLENSQRFINISFINELNIIATKIGVNLWEVIEAAKTKPFGFTAYYPGPGIGGHCIPVDPFYLTWVGMKEGAPLTMIHQADVINELMPHYVIGRAVEELAHQSIPLSRAKIGLIGLAYKKDVNDVRESPALKILHLLRDHYGADVRVYDPLVADVTAYAQPFSLTAVELRALDLVVILVDHTQVAWEKIEKFSRCILDTRNVMADFDGHRVRRL